MLTHTSRDAWPDQSLLAGTGLGLGSAVMSSERAAMSKHRGALHWPGPSVVCPP